MSRKRLLLGFVSGISFLRYEARFLNLQWEMFTNKSGISPLSSSIIASGVTEVDKEFHNTSSILSTFAVSMFLLGYAVSDTFESDFSVLTIYR